MRDGRREEDFWEFMDFSPFKLVGSMGRSYYPFVRPNPLKSVTKKKIATSAICLVIGHMFPAWTNCAHISKI